jgi:hypothetical protein
VIRTEPSVKAAAPFVLAAFCGACASAGLPAPGVAERARAATTYSASLTASLRGKDLRGRTRVLLAFRRPDALRLEIPGPTGPRLTAVTGDGRLVAVFPAERAVFESPATPAALDALVGVALTPEELIDLLVGVPSSRLRSYRARWGATVPREIEAELPDGARLVAKVEEAETDAALPAAAFTPPPHAGYRSIEAEEARRLWGSR